MQEFAHLSTIWQQLVSHQVSSRSKEQFERQPLSEKEIEYATEYKERWQMLRSIRSAVLKAIEGLREKGIIKHSLEAQVIMHIDEKAAFAKSFHDLCADLRNTPQGVHGFFEEFFIVSSVVLEQGNQNLVDSEYPGFSVRIEKAPGQKCPRCWQWKETVHDHGLCARCAGIVNK